MAKPSKPRRIGRNILLGVAVTTLPLAGCDVTGGGGPQVTVESVPASAQERAAFERARDAGTIAAAERFLSEYPNGAFVRSLLTDASIATLNGIDRELISQISPSVLNSLPIRVKQALGIRIRAATDNTASVPYSG